MLLSVAQEVHAQRADGVRISERWNLGRRREGALVEAKQEEPWISHRQISGVLRQPGETR